MPAEFLYGPDVLSICEQMRCKRVPKRVTGGCLGNPDLGRGRFDDPLEDRWVQVMAPLLGGPGIRPVLLLREQELPAPLRGRASVELRVRSGARS